MIIRFWYLTCQFDNSKFQNSKDMLLYREVYRLKIFFLGNSYTIYGRCADHLVFVFAEEKELSNENQFLEKREAEFSFS